MNKLLPTFKVLKNPCVFCMTPATAGLAALFARCGELFGDSMLHSRQLSSDADLLKCFPKLEHRGELFAD